MSAIDHPATIRRIRLEDGELLRDARLRAVTDSPDAFGHPLASLASQPLAEWQTDARRSSQGPSRAWFLAEQGDAVVGLALGRRRPPETLLVFSVWVDPAARRSGIGQRLIEAAEGWAAESGLRQTVLWVMKENAVALRFYLGLGFQVVLEGPDATAGLRYGSIAMRRPIGAAD